MHIPCSHEISARLFRTQLENPCRSGTPEHALWRKGFVSGANNYPLYDNCQPSTGEGWQAGHEWLLSIQPKEETDET